MQSTGTPSDGTVLPASIASSGNFSFPQLTVTGTSSLGDDVTFTGANYNVVWDKSANALEFADNALITLGTGNDLQIIHDGSNSRLKNNTGTLFLQSNGIKLKNFGSTEHYINCIDNGAVELYYDSSKKFETTSTGATVTGSLTVTNDITLQDDLFMGDGDEIQMGDGSDLRIYHDGLNSKIINTTGFLVIQTDQFTVNDAGNNHGVIRSYENAQVELYHNGTKKFETTSTGAKVYGDFLPNTGDTHDLGANAAKWSELHLKHYLYMPDAGRIRLGSSYDMQLFYDGSHQVLLGKTGTTYITCPSGQSVRLNKSSADNFNAESMLRAFADGAVELYYDNSKKFETNSDGGQIFSNLEIGNTSAPFLIESTTSGNGQEDIGRIGMNRTNSSTSDRQMWLQYTVGASAAQAAFQARSANDTGTAGTYLKIDAVNNNVDIPRDNEKLQIGAGNDLQIYHDGTNSLIKNQTNSLYLLSADTRITNGGVTEHMAKFFENGAVELFCDNSKKFETTSTGNLSTGVHKFITGSGSTASDDNVLHIVAGSTADRGIMIGTGRAGGAQQNDGMGFIDAINSESNGYGSQLQFRIDGTPVMSIGNQSNDFVGIGTTTPGKPLHVDSGSSTSNHFIAEFTGVDTTSRAASCNFFYMGCGTDDNRTGLYWEHQNVVNIRMWMDDSGTLRQSSSNPTANNSGTAFSYAGGSDYRLKTNVVNYTNAITELKQLKPYKFNYIETDRTLVDKPDVLCSGFYAHEAGAVVPSSLLGEKDEIDFEGNPVYQSLKYEKFVPLLTAALQEAVAKIETLEAKVAALEAA
jgi:hypothetical protein